MSKLSIGLALGLILAGCDAAHLDSDDPGADAGLPNDNAALSALGISDGALEPAFDPAVTSYTLTLGLAPDELVVIPAAQVPGGVTIEVAGSPVLSGEASDAVSLAFGSTSVDVVVTPEAGPALTYTIEVIRGLGIVQDAYVKASNTDTNADTFGFAVAVDGDTVVVGARLEDSGANGTGGGAAEQDDNSLTNSGAVYVFVRDAGGSWMQEAYIKPSNPDNSDFFGHSVALSGDTLAVGSLLEDSAAIGTGGGAAEQADNTASAAGAVYVYTRTAGVWSQQAYIKASNTEASDEFGQSMDLDGDTLVVGAFLEDSVSGANQADNTALSAGAAYVFVRNGTTWTQQAYLKATLPTAGDQFGSSVAISGDTIAVGAPLEDSAARGINGDQADETASSAGAVWVYVRSGTNWTLQAYVKGANTDAGDRFGESVALSGETLVVGAENEASAATGVGGDPLDNNAAGAGAAYVFVRNVAAWSQQAYIKASNTGASDNFGSSIAIDGDVLAVGALFEDSAATGLNGDGTDDTVSGAGAAYVFIRVDGAWTPAAYLKAPDVDTFDELGLTIDVSGGLVAVGAPFEDSAGIGINPDPTDDTASSAGAVYVFR